MEAQKFLSLQAFPLISTLPDVLTPTHSHTCFGSKQLLQEILQRGESPAHNPPAPIRGTSGPFTHRPHVPWMI